MSLSISRFYVAVRLCSPADQGAAKPSPILILEKQGNPSINCLIVTVASGIAGGRVSKTALATTESRKMVSPQTYGNMESTC